MSVGVDQTSKHEELFSGPHSPSTSVSTCPDPSVNGSYASLLTQLNAGSTDGCGGGGGGRGGDLGGGGVGGEVCVAPLFVAYQPVIGSSFSHSRSAVGLCRKV